eukprot:399513-Amphidinium_carterae.1
MAAGPIPTDFSTWKLSDLKKPVPKTLDSEIPCCGSWVFKAQQLLARSHWLAPSKHMATLDLLLLGTDDHIVAN